MNLWSVSIREFLHVLYTAQHTIRRLALCREVLNFFLVEANLLMILLPKKKT